MEQISIQEIEKGIADLRAAEAKLMAVFGFKPTVRTTRGRKPAKRASNGHAAPKRHSNGITDKQARARKRQGVYLAAMRGLSATSRKRVSHVRQVEGFTAAIKLAKSLSA